MTDTYDFSERNAYENSVTRNVRMIARNGEAHALIRARLPFTNKTGSFRGVVIFGVQSIDWPEDSTHAIVTARNGRHTLTLGDLPSELIAMMREDLYRIRDYSGNFYIVLSYFTPIAWTRSIEHMGALMVPAVIYSHTTTRHQTATKGE